MVSLKSVDISGNEYDATPWSYLLPEKVQLKVFENLDRSLWGLGPVRMLEEPTIDAALFDEFAGL